MQRCRHVEMLVCMWHLQRFRWSEVQSEAQVQRGAEQQVKVQVLRYIAGAIVPLLSMMQRCRGAEAQICRCAAMQCRGTEVQILRGRGGFEVQRCRGAGAGA